MLSAWAGAPPPNTATTPPTSGASAPCLTFMTLPRRWTRADGTSRPCVCQPLVSWLTARQIAEDFQMAGTVEATQTSGNGAAGPNEIEVVNPATGQVIGKVPDMTAEQVR